MAVTNERYKKGQTDLSAAGTYYSGTAPSAWDDGSTLTFDEGGPAVFTAPTALNAVDLNIARFTPGFRSPVGSTASYIQFGVSSGTTPLFDYNAAGPWAYVEGATGNANIDELWWRPTANGLGVFKTVDVPILYVAGPFKFTDTMTGAAVRTSSGGGVDIAEHSSDTLTDIDAFGLSTITLRRGMTGTTLIGPGARVIVDYDGSLSGTFKLCGGTLEHRRGNVIVIGNAGTYDASALERSTYTLNIIDTPDLTEIYGPVKPVITRTKTWGGGSVKKG